MATKEDYARWIVENQDKKGTPEFETVARAYKAAGAAPKGMSPEAAREQVAAQDAEWRAGIDPTEGMSGPQKFLAGMGKAVTDLGRGAGQMLGVVDEEDVAESRERDAALMNTGAGKVGNFTGAVATAVPASMIPGANTIAGAGVLGAGLGLLQPTVEGESRTLNTALGAGLGSAGQYGGNKLAQALSRRIQAAPVTRAANEVKDRVLRETADSGYTVLPTEARAGLTAKMGQALSGKYKTQELARIRNQPVTNALARRAVGLADDTPITRETLGAVREQAFNAGYAPVRNAGTVKTDAAFTQKLDDIVSQFRGAARSFPGAVSDDVVKEIDGIRVGSFDAGDGIDMIAVLRGKADKAYAGGDSQLGGTFKRAASALEDQIERHLDDMGGSGKDMLAAFRDARTKMAKTFTLQKAATPTGDVDALTLANQLKRGKPLTDEIRTIAQAGDSFKGAMKIPEAGSASPFTIFDAGFSGFGSAAAGNPLPVLLPAARVASRYSILSRPVQNSMASKSYDPSVLARALLGRPGQAATRYGALSGVSPLAAAAQD